MAWLVTRPYSLVGSPVASNAAMMRSAVSITVVTAGDAVSGLQEAIAVRLECLDQAHRAAIRSLTGSAGPHHRLTLSTTRIGESRIFLLEAVMCLLRDLPGEVVVIGPCHRPPGFWACRRGVCRARCVDAGAALRNAHGVRTE